MDLGRYMDIPDTFALLPRKNSDIYFSIDTLYDPPSVMCLGGPNLNRRSMETGNQGTKSVFVAFTETTFVDYFWTTPRGMR